jgi:hypothetical protein
MCYKATDTNQDPIYEIISMGQHSLIRTLEHYNMMNKSKASDDSNMQSTLRVRM